MSQQEVTIQKNRWLAERYGSRRGVVRTYWHQLLYFLGRYRNYQEVDWQSVERLVFVCKGNICRSAYAEAVARSLGVEAISCGLDTIEDAPANEQAARTARKMGYSLEKHKTMPFMYVIFRTTDLLVAMEPWQARFLGRHLSRKHYCTLLGLWSQPILPHIQDPYGALPAYFEHCFDGIAKSVHGIVAKIQKPQ